MDSKKFFDFLYKHFKELARDNKSCTITKKFYGHSKTFECVVYYNYDEIEEFAEILRNTKGFKKHCSIRSPGTHISISISGDSDDDGYVNITESPFYNVGINPSRNYKKFEPEKEKYRKLTYRNNEQMYTMYQGKKPFPCNLKSFGYISELLRNAIFKFFSGYNPIWKDFQNSEELPPIPLNIVWASYNKKQLLENRFKAKLPNSINKLEILASYAACCSMKYVLPEQRSVLFSDGADIGFMILTKTTMKKIAYAYICSVVNNRVKSEWYSNIIEDYILMAIDMRRPINLLLGNKGYKRLHDELMVASRLKDQRKKIKIPNNKLSKIALPKNFKRITTNKALIEESVENNNCVHSYINKINEGRCLIYTLDYNDEHCTIEIMLEKGKYYVNQITKKHNQPISPKTDKYIEEVIQKANQSNRK